MIIDSFILTQSRNGAKFLFFCVLALLCSFLVADRFYPRNLILAEALGVVNVNLFSVRTPNSLDLGGNTAPISLRVQSHAPTTTYPLDFIRSIYEMGLSIGEILTVINSNLFLTIQPNLRSMIRDA